MTKLIYLYYICAQALTIFTFTVLKRALFIGDRLEWSDISFPFICMMILTPVCILLFRKIAKEI